jgi:hypothetical protein
VYEVFTRRRILVSGLQLQVYEALSYQPMLLVYEILIILSQPADFVYTNRPTSCVLVLAPNINSTSRFLMLIITQAANFLCRTNYNSTCRENGAVRACAPAKPAPLLSLPHSSSDLLVA